MSFEIEVLAWAGLLAVVQLIALSVAANTLMSSHYLAGPRDEAPRMPPLVGRLDRAFRNHLEGLVMFAVAALAVHLDEASDTLTQNCALAYLIARVAYVPTYALGIRYLRSAVWMVGFAATAIMLISALEGGGYLT